MTIELNLQDLYFAEQPGPISTTTWQDWVQKWSEDLALEVFEAQAGCEMTLRLTEDWEIQELNAQYRQKDQPTDVLAFASLEVDSPYNNDFYTDEPLYLGDVIISVETAKKQAQEHSHSLTYELAWLLCHGFLHLLGWDHPDETSLEEMLAQQEHLLKSIGLSSAN
jgi:probable rRNA maturation factor